jgi:hypothetical protein
MALGLWNLTKYLVVTTFLRYAWRYGLDFWHTYMNVRNVNLICNSSLYTHIHVSKIKSISPSIAKRSGDNYGNYLAKFHSPRAITRPKIIKYLVVTSFFPMLGDIDLVFGIWVYNDELQIKMTFRSGSMIYGRAMALGLWNLAK